MELQPPPEQVREYRKQAKPRVENALSPVCQLAPHTGNRHGQQDGAAGQPQMTTVAPRDPGTLGDSQELRDWHFVFYQRGKVDDVKL